MIIETGHYALALALALSVIQCVVPFWGARRGDVTLMRVAESTALGQCLFVSLAFAALLYARLVSDFSLATVAETSYSFMPTLYKISGLWGNHEGSMLLWCLVLSVFGTILTLTGHSLPRTLKADALAVQGGIGTAFLLFILVTSDPFRRLNPAPFEGQDLNPVLQDIGLALHPPVLYTGYVGFSIVFSFAAAALVSGRIDAAWAHCVRPYALIAWSFLTLGITLGSYWAYYTLGWGGFWFWDPVENASLMPWLAGTGLIHALNVMEKRDSLKIWTVFLSILTFFFALLGTFLVRSGVLTSVHAFASDPQRGIAILIILSVFIFGAFSLFAWRAPMLKQGGLFAPFSREGALVLNNLLLISACTAVLVGTLYPLVLENWTGEKISVGPPFFNLSVGALLLAMCWLMPCGFSLGWKRGRLMPLVKRLRVPLGLALLTLVIFPRQALIAAAACFVLTGSVAELAARPRWRLPFLSGFCAHIGVGVFLLGLAGAYFGTEHIANIQPEQSVDVGPCRLRYTKLSLLPGANYQDVSATMPTTCWGGYETVLTPARRHFSATHTTTTQAAIATLYAGQLYVAIQEPETDGTLPVRIYWKPLVICVWLGPLLIALGGFLAFANRRLRLGIPTRTLAMLVLLLAVPAYAISPNEALPDPTQEARARALSAQMRCLVCQNESLDESDADLARDIRLLIRRQISQGQSDTQIEAYLVSRYGDFILLKPPLKRSTLALWLSAPTALFAGGVAILLASCRRQEPLPPLSEEEEQSLRERFSDGAA